MSNVLPEKIKDKIYTFLRGLKSDIDLGYHITIDDIDLNDPYNSIYGMLEDAGAFDIEIIYYSSAMKYLSENDNSLRNSLDIADAMGFTPKNLNSEILASLLASENSREEFAELENEINEFFKEIKEELEDKEDED